MRKVTIAFAATIALLVAGVLAWNAQAAPFAGTAPAKNYSPIERVGCGGAGRCPWGRTWVCGPRGCGCAPCGGGGGYGWRRRCAVWVAGVCVR
jgi:hypothetical protein